MLTPDRSDREQGLGSAWGPGRPWRWTAWGRGWAELPELRSVFFPVPPLLPGFLSSPLRLAGCVLRPVPGTGRLTHQTLLPPHQGKFCIFLPIPAWQGLPAPSRPGPEQRPWVGQGRARPQATLFPRHPPAIEEGKAKPPVRGSGAAPGPSAGKPEPGLAGERARGWVCWHSEAPGTRCASCVTGGGPPLHPRPQFPHPQSRSSHRCPAQL